MANLYRALLGLLPDPSLQVGTVASVAGGVSSIILPGGGRVQAQGVATVGTKVFFRNGVIHGDAPNLPVEVIEI